MSSESEHTPTPWAYRPNEHDDWGWIRDAEGAIAAAARDGRVYSDRWGEFRAAKKDPYEANAAFIVKAVNSYDAMRSALEELQILVSEYDTCNSDWKFRKHVILKVIDAALLPTLPGADQ